MRDEDRVMLNCKTDSSHINNITRYKRAILAFFINSTWYEFFISQTFDELIPRLINSKTEKCHRS